MLFDDASGEALCVIDLDTVMPGSLLADFGDLVRTAACREAEDSRAIERIRAEPDLYAALAEGYLAGSGPWITPAERELLEHAATLHDIGKSIQLLYYPPYYSKYNPIERCWSRSGTGRCSPVLRR